jgi:hypothetical protein
MNKPSFARSKALRLASGMLVLAMLLSGCSVLSRSRPLRK